MIECEQTINTCSVWQLKMVTNFICVCPSICSPFFCWRSIVNPRYWKGLQNGEFKMLDPRWRKMLVSVGVDSSGWGRSVGRDDQRYCYKLMTGRLKLILLDTSSFYFFIQYISVIDAVFYFRERRSVFIRGISCFQRPYPVRLHSCCLSLLRQMLLCLLGDISKSRTWYVTK